jgi:hypothetical protein
MVEKRKEQANEAGSENYSHTYQLPFALQADTVTSSIAIIGSGLHFYFTWQTMYGVPGYIATFKLEVHNDVISFCGHNTKQ